MRKLGHLVSYPNFWPKIPFHLSFGSKYFFCLSRINFGRGILKYLDFFIQGKFSKITKIGFNLFNSIVFSSLLISPKKKENKRSIKWNFIKNSLLERSGRTTSETKWPRHVPSSMPLDYNCTTPHVLLQNCMELKECSWERSGEGTTKIRMILHCHHITTI